MSTKTKLLSLMAMTAALGTNLFPPNFQSNIENKPFMKMCKKCLNKFSGRGKYCTECYEKYFKKNTGKQ